MTYKEALDRGYIQADQKYQRGYISRRIDADGQQVYTAGRARKGEKYVLLPCWNSTQYCVRQYLRLQE